MSTLEEEIRDEVTVVRRLFRGRQIGAVYRRFHDGTWYGWRWDHRKGQRLESFRTRTAAVQWLAKASLS